MIYCFKCVTPEHPADKPREFESIIHHVPKKVITQYPCPICKGLGKRDLSKEIPTQALVGVQSISTSTTGPGSIYKEIKFAFGERRVNPDGTQKNEAPFRDMGELNKFMNGQNDMGEPVLNDKGEPIRRQDGSFVRRGAKLVKYTPNRAPSKVDVRKMRPPVEDAWVDANDSSLRGVGVKESSLGYSSSGKEIKTSAMPRYHSPQRGKK